MRLTRAERGGVLKVIPHDGLDRLFVPGRAGRFEQPLQVAEAEVIHCEHRGMGGNRSSSRRRGGRQGRAVEWGHTRTEGDR